MKAPTTIARTVFFGSAGQVRTPQEPPAGADAPGRVPRVARLLALAIRFQELVAEGVVRDYAEVARLGYVSRARVTQITNLLHLAPDIQEEILFLPAEASGRETLTERLLRPLAAEPDWRVQRRMWRRLKQRAYIDKEGRNGQC